MKTVSWKISMEQADALVASLFDNGFEPLCIPGSLQDNWICYIGENSNYKMGRYKLRKYILIREVYENTWSSGLELELTDDDSVFEAWIRHYEEYMEEFETA